MKKIAILLLGLMAMAGTVTAQTPYVMSGGDKTWDFADIANWANNFASGTDAANWGSVAIIGSGTSVTTGTRTTKSSATFVTGSSGGVQKGTQTLVFLSTGSTATPEAVAVDLFLNFTGRIAGTLSFDWAALDNSAGTRPTSLRIFWSTDGTTFTEITGAQVLDKLSSDTGSITDVALPVEFNNSATARLRFYNHAGTITGSGSRYKLQIDNVEVTSISATPTVTIANTGTPAASDIIQGTNDDVLFGFSLTPSASIDFTAVSIATSGTADAGDVSNFRLVYDADNDGVFDGGESVIATVATLANPLVFNSFSPAQTGISTRRYLLVADVAADATLGATFSASIASAINVISTGDATGTAAGNTQTVISASTPTITASTASLSSFGDVAFGSVSSEQSFTVSGDNLTADVTATAPTHFQVSLSTGTGFAGSVNLAQSGGNITGEPVTVFVRLNPASAAGAVSGNVSLTSTDATAQNVAVSGFALDSQPTSSASGISFTSVTTTGFTINWTRGDGDNVLVLMKASGAVDADPSDKSTYTANAAFGSGSQIGTGNYVVYEGVGTSVAVTGLVAGTTYHVEVFEFNADATGTQNYETTGATASQAIAIPDPSVVITKYANGSPDIIELMVIEDELDMRGMILKDFSSSMAGDGGKAYTFTTNALWESVKAGTIIIIRNNNSAADVTSSDLSIDVGVQNSTYFTDPGSGSFDISTTEMIMIKSAGSATSGVTGSIHVLAAGTAGSNYTAAAPPKLIATGTTGSNFGVYANMTNGLLSDFNGTDATGNFASASLTFGTPQTTTLEIYRNNIKTYHASSLSTTAGWRMMSSPVSTTYATLLGPVWTQGSTGSDSPSVGAPNVFTHASGDENYTAVTDLGATIPAGQGFIYYHFADDNYDLTPNAAPTTLTVTGTENAVNTQFAPSHTSGIEYAIAGNPFASSIQFDNVGRAGNGQNKMWVWNPATSEYLTRSSGDGTSSGLVAPFQAFWVEYTGSGSSFTFGSGAKSTGASFLGKEAVTPELTLKLSDGSRSNVVWFGLRDDASVGMDPLDAAKFIPLATDYLMAYSVAESKNLDLNFLPSGATETIRIPLGYETTGSTDLQWTLDANSFPTGWMVSIEDSETGTTHPVNADFSLRFAGSRSKAAPVDPLAISRNPVFKTAATAPRFTLTVDPAKTTSVDGGPETVGRMELEQNYPNPFNPSTVVGFRLSVVGKAKLSVYDVLGREVAVLVDGTMPAGAHSVTFDASNLTSGVYLYKLEAGGMTQVRRMSLVK